MLASFDSGEILAEERASEEQYKLIVENSRLQQTNNQLAKDYKNLQKQFDELANSYPSIEKINKQNSALTKQVSDLNIQNEELNRRLTISLRSNSELTEKLNSAQNSLDSNYSMQFSRLNSEMAILKQQSQATIDNLKEKNKELETSLKKNEREYGILKNQVSKLLCLSQNYFKTEIKTIDDLYSNLLTTPDRSKSSESENSTNEEKNSDIKNYQIKISHLKAQLKNQKQKKKQTELELLKIQKQNDLNELKITELQTQINDITRNNENKLRNLEVAHQQEMLNLQQNKPKYKTASIQTESEKKENIESHQSQPIELNNSSELIENQIKASNNIDIIEKMKNQIRSLIVQLKKSEAKQDGLREKNQFLILKINTLEKENKSLQKELFQSTMNIQQLEQENESLNGQSKSNSKNENSNDKLEIFKLQQSTELLEKLTASQKVDIDKFTKERNHILSLLQYQNEALNAFDQVIENMNQSEISEIKAPSVIEEEEDKVENEKEEIIWDFGTLPESIVSILKTLTENEGFSMNSKIHHVFNVISKWYNNNEISHGKEITEYQGKIDESIEQYNNLKDNLTAILCQKEPQDIINQVNEITNQNAVLQQKVNELERNQNEQNTSFNESQEAEIKHNQSTLMKMQTTLKELNLKCKLRKNQLKQCKAAFVECQKRSAEEIKTLRSTNLRSRKELEEVQKSYNELHKQYQQLSEEIVQINKNQSEEINQSHEDFESIMMQNTSNFDDYQNQMNAELTNKKNEIVSLNFKIDDQKRKIEQQEQYLKYYEEENKKLKTEYDKLKRESDDRITFLEDQKEEYTRELENHFNKTFDSLITKNKELTEQVKNLQDPIDKEMKNCETIKFEYEEKISQLTFQIEQDKVKFESMQDSLERQNKLLSIQNNAKLMSVETNYSIKCDEIKKEYELKKKELLGFIAQQFRPFYNIKMALDEDAVKNIVKQIKAEISNYKKKDEGMRKLLMAKDDQSTEDALTELILSMHPQLAEQ